MIKNFFKSRKIDLQMLANQTIVAHSALTVLAVGYFWMTGKGAAIFFFGVLWILALIIWIEYRSLFEAIECRDLP